jgi:hypothetical protein
MFIKSCQKTSLRDHVENAISVRYYKSVPRGTVSCSAGKRQGPRAGRDAEGARGAQHE